MGDKREVEKEEEDKDEEEEEERPGLVLSGVLETMSRERVVDTDGETAAVDVRGTGATGGGARDDRDIAEGCWIRNRLL